MNRLQKKCTMVTVGIHLLLLVILIVGPGFFAPKSKVDTLPVLDVIPANLVEAAINSGVQDAQPPPPTPVVTPPPPLPPPPTPVVTPPPKVETPEPVKPVEKELTPEPKPPEHQIQPDLTPVVRRVPKNVDQPNPRDEAQKKQQALAAAARNIARSLKKNMSSATVIDVPGNSNASVASYAAVVKSIYERTMNDFLPNEVANDNEITKVLVTIASDGTVISARITAPSGDSAWDTAVQHTLDRVTFIAPFPEGATEKELTYPISFNPEVERTL
jgi:TonB family protein